MKRDAEDMSESLLQMKIQGKERLSDYQEASRAREEELKRHSEALWEALPALASGSREKRGKLLGDAIFDGADVNENGALSRTELKKFLRGHCHMARLVRPLND